MKLRWTPLAVGHLKSAYEYVAKESSSAAEKLIQRILAAGTVLEEHPHLGRVGRVEGTREFIITGTPFVVPYRIRRDQAEILAVLHAARRWPESF
ncbi:MAG: type II toxin-antitoxin system RelE/ParE family toxin [Terriglobia bacterium]